MTRPLNVESGNRTQVCRCRGGRLATKPTRWCVDNSRWDLSISTCLCGARGGTNGISMTTHCRQKEKVTDYHAFDSVMLSDPWVKGQIVTTNCLSVGCLTSQQHASVSQGRICSDNFTCCHTEIKVADQTFYLTQSQYTDTGPATGVPIFKSLV